MKLNALKPTAIALLSLFVITSCVKDDDYEIPDPNGKKPLPSFSGQIVTFDVPTAQATNTIATYGADDAIEGYVISSDEAGNFFKKIYIQNEDKTKAVTIAINKTGLASEFPIGTKVQLRLKGLSFHTNNGGVDFGYGIYQGKNNKTSVEQMSEAIYKKHLFDIGGTRKTLAELSKTGTSISTLKVENNVNQLITLKGVHFKTTDVGKTLHLATNDKFNGTDYTLTDAQGNTIPFRTSKYAKFKDEKIPAGNLDVTGVLTKYGQNWQFMINSYTDIVVTGTSTATQTTTTQTIEANTATAAIFEDGKTISLHGTIITKAGRAHFRLSDGTLIQVYPAKDVSNEVKEKLATEGYEVTVKGVLGEFKGTKQIQPAADADVTFGTAPVAPTYQTLNASTATMANYADGKYVKLHGTITVEGTGKNAKSYILLSDNTKIQLYAANIGSISKDKQDKLKTSGQQVTIAGKFENYTDAKGNTIHELIYVKDNDVVLGNAGAPQPSTTIEANTATAAIFEDGKTISLHGTIITKAGRAHFRLSDGTLIQVYPAKDVSNEVKEKLATEGYEVTVKGVLGEFKGTKQIQPAADADVTFGTAPVAPTYQTLNASTATMANYADGKYVKLHGTITVEGTGKNAKSYILLSDNTKIQLYAANIGSISKDKQDKLKTSGQQVTIAGKFENYTDAKGNTIHELIYVKDSDVEL